MKGVARISFDGGVVFLPARTPYEQEMLFDHLEQAARRFGDVSVELDRQNWHIDFSSALPRETCTECGRTLDMLKYTLGRDVLCARCVRRAVPASCPSVIGRERKGTHRKEPELRQTQRVPHRT